jgi:hypothetical protein
LKSKNGQWSKWQEEYRGSGETERMNYHTGAQSLGVDSGDIYVIDEDAAGCGKGWD